MRRAIYWAPSITIMAAITWLSHQPDWPLPAQGSPDWLLHGVAYGALSVANGFGLAAGRGRRALRPGLVLFAFAVASAFGALDEIHQSFVPGRDSSLGDWSADTIGAALGSLGLWWSGRH